MTTQSEAPKCDKPGCGREMVFSGMAGAWFCSNTTDHHAALARITELESEVEYLKNNYKESCLWPSTIIESDQKMADGRPCKMAAIPNWCIHKIETNARKGK